MRYSQQKSNQSPPSLIEFSLQLYFVSMLIAITPDIFKGGGCVRKRKSLWNHVRTGTLRRP